MPYKSKAQQRYMHAAAARGDIKKSVVKDFDNATKGRFGDLPERAKKEASMHTLGRMLMKIAKVSDAERAHKELAYKQLSSRQSVPLRGLAGLGLGALIGGALGGMQEKRVNGGPWTSDFDTERGTVGAIAGGLVAGGSMALASHMHNKTMITKSKPERMRLAAALAATRANGLV